MPVRQHLRDVRAEDFLIIRGRSCTPLQALFPPTLCPLAEAQPSPDVAEPLLQATSYIFTCHPCERLWTKLDSGCSLLSGRGRSDWCRSKNWILVPLLRLPWGRTCHLIAAHMPRTRMSTLGRTLSCKRRNHLRDQGQPENLAHLAPDYGTRMRPDRWSVFL